MLLWQGHGERVWDYTWDQIDLFVSLANERLEHMYSAGNRD